jgi:glycosyltransferase involved in cell wall biosynthesis
MKIGLFCSEFPYKDPKNGTILVAQPYGGVEVGNYEIAMGLVDSIRILLDNEVIYNQKKSEMKELVKKYNWSKLLEKMVNYYDEIIQIKDKL